MFENIPEDFQNSNALKSHGRHLILGGNAEDQAVFSRALSERYDIEKSVIYGIPSYLESIHSGIKEEEVGYLLHHLEEVRESLLRVSRLFDQGEFQEVLEDFYFQLSFLQRKYYPDLALEVTHHPVSNITAAGILLFCYDDQGNVQILIQKLSYGDEGWGTLGGESDPEDSDLADTASREAREESSWQVAIPPIQLRESHYHELYTKTADSSYLFRMYVAEISEKIDHSSIEHDECTACIWFPLEDLLQAIEQASASDLQEGKLLIEINGKKQAVHKSFVKMLAQQEVREHLQKLSVNEPYVQKITPPERQMKTPGSMREEIAKQTLQHAQVLRELKTKFTSALHEEAQTVMPNRDSTSLCQSEIYLKTVLKDKFPIEGSNRENLKEALNLFLTEYSHFKEQELAQEAVEQLWEIL